MKAWRVEGVVEPRDALVLEDIEVSESGPGQLLVSVRATAANVPDVLMCRGEYQTKPELPFTPGVEPCGTVVVGDEVDRAPVGDRVLGSPALPHGGFAEYARRLGADVVVDRHEQDFAELVPGLVADSPAGNGGPLD